MNNQLPIYSYHKLRILCYVIGISLLFLPTSSWAQPNILIDNTTHSVSYNGSFQDFVIPASFAAGEIEFTLRGGDGGNAGTDDGCSSNGGRGATVTATFAVGTGSGKIAPGSLISFILGGRGQGQFTNTGITGTGFAAAAGGGATGIIYLAPGASTWIPLAVAGGGGGAFQGAFLGGCVDSESGRGGNSSTSGDGGTGDFFIASGGSGGQGGGSSLTLGNGSGGGFLSDGGGATCTGLTCCFGITSNQAGEGHRATDVGSAPGQSEGCTTFGGWTTGGYGYGSGGAGAEAAGGAGGYSGGGAGGSTGSGGGGGSFVASFDLTSTKTNGSNGAGSSSHGIASYRAIQIPANDLCGGAINLGCGGSSSGTNDFATANDAPFNCGGLTTEPGVWFKFTGTGGMMTVSTTGSNFDTKLFVYSGSCGSLTCISSNDDIGGGILQSLVGICTSPSTTYYTYLDGFSGATGNYSISLTCSNNPPTISCPGNISRNTDPGQCSSVTSYTVSASDDCSVSSNVRIGGLASGAAFPLGSTLVTWRATDAAGLQSTCSFTVTVNDTEPPNINCPADFTSNTDPGQCTGSPTYSVTAGDNCTLSSNVRIGGPASGGTFQQGPNLVTWQATDAEGAQSSCSFTVTIIDVEPPVISCPGNVSISNDQDSCNAMVTGLVASSADACPGTTIANNSPYAISGGADASGRYPVGTTVVEFVATDIDGNTDACSVTVTVIDTKSPVASCHFNIVLGLNSKGEANISPNSINNKSSDNCSIASMALSKKNFTCADIGTVQTTLTVTDPAGNSNSCITNVIIQDNEKPVAVCQDITLELDASGNLTVMGSLLDGGSTDNCAITDYAVSPPTFDCGDIGPNPVVLTITDEGNNMDDCNAVITVEDNTAPAASCKNITVQLDALGNANITSSDIDDGSSDACGIAGYSLDNSSFDCSDLGSNNVTMTVTDSSGNSSQCVSMVEVETSAPQNILTTNVGYTTATLNWDAVPWAAGYIITGNPVGAGFTVTLMITSGSTNSFNVSGLTPGTAYEWQIQAVCALDITKRSPFSEPDTFTTLTCPNPDSLMVTQNSSSSVTLSWANTENYAGAWIFVYCIDSSFNGVYDVLSRDITSITVDNLTCNKKYVWKVKIGCGTWSSYDLSEFSDLDTFMLMCDPIPPDTTFKSICEGDSIFAGGAYQTMSGAYSDTFLSSTGVDSILVCVLTVNPAVMISLCPDQNVPLFESPGQNCDCNGKIVHMSVIYDGPAGATITIGPNSSGSNDTIYTNVQPGDTLSPNLGDIGNNWYWAVNGTVDADIHTSCSDDILNNVNSTKSDFGHLGQFPNPHQNSNDGTFLVIGFTDDIGNSCGFGGPDPVCPEVQVTVMVMGGTAGFSYMWSNGTTDSTLIDSICASTSYNVTVTDANGCTATGSHTATVIDISCDDGKVTMCHEAGTSNAHTHCINITDIQTKLDEGYVLGDCITTFDAGSCGPPPPPPPPPVCMCDGKIVQMTVIYNGPTGATVDVGPNSSGSNSMIYSNVNPGDTLIALLGNIGNNWYWSVNDSVDADIHTSCSDDILGNVNSSKSDFGHLGSYPNPDQNSTDGTFLVIGHVDENGNVCMLGQNVPKTSIKLNSFESKIAEMSVYPNPNDGNYKIVVNNLKGNPATLRVLDIAGREFFSKSINSDVSSDFVEFEMTNSARGTYFVELKMESEVIVRKVIIF